MINGIEKKKDPGALEDRFVKFSKDSLDLVRSLPKTEENKIYGRQYLKSSSSAGANFFEATCALTRKDFTHDMNKARKEMKETNYWLKLLTHANPSYKDNISPLLKESDELLRILSKSVKTAKKNGEEKQ